MLKIQKQNQQLHKRNVTDLYLKLFFKFLSKDCCLLVDQYAK